MFSQLSDRTTHLLNKKYTFKEDSYILYKGGMVSSNLIDIEVIMKNHPEIKSKIIVDLKENIEVLQMRIVELVEKFPKLSGLSELVAKDLSLKTEKGLVPLFDKKLDSFIKSRDVIFFDLEFKEIWLEIEMSLHSEDKLKHILIKMGIKSWAKYMLDDDDSDDIDYYIFSKFSINFPDNNENSENSLKKELENFHERVGDKFNFKSKIACKLEFINLNDIMYKELAKLNEEKYHKSSWLNKFDFNRKKVLKKFINEYLEKFCKFDIKNSHIATHKNVIWKWNDENVMIRVSSSHILRVDEESHRDSLIDYTYSYANAYMMETRCYVNPLEAMYITQGGYGGIFRGGNLKLNNKTHAKFDSKYTQDFNLLQTIDCFKIINKLSGSFFSNLEFDCVYLPDTKNLKKISKENSISFVKKSHSIKRSSSNSDFFTENKENFKIKFKFKFRHIKKNSHILILFFCLFILFIWIMY